MVLGNRRYCVPFWDFFKITSGSAQVLGFDVATQVQQVRAHTAYLPGDPRLYRAMKGRSVLKMFAEFHPNRTLEQTLVVADRLELDLNRRVMFMSTGMRQKLALCVVLGCKAPLVMLDEPTANLDPNVRSIVLDLVREIRADGRTVVLSSHIFSDIDETCDRVAIMRQGEIVVEQDLCRDSNLHIVRCRTSESLEEIESAFHQSELVTHWAKEVRSHSDATAGCQANATQIELHLSGSPDDWLTWLQTLPVSVERIEKAGVSALYKRFHHAHSDFQSSDGRAL